MRNVVLLLLFFHTFSVIGQPIYTIPWATTQPVFVFPIYFEDGIGQRDTLYAGYDPTASDISFSIQDTVFGVKKIPLDTSRFYAVWDTYYCSSGLCDEGYKANVTTTFQFSNIFPQLNRFECNKGVLPLKISWDKQLFYSDSLPFQQNNPAPNGQGRLYFNCSFCQASENSQPVNHINGEVLVCDSMCTSRDSIVIYSILGTNDSVAWASFFFYIEQWSNGWVAIDEIIDSDYYEIQFKNDLLSVINRDVTSHISIVDLYGKMILNKFLGINEILDKNIPKGIFFVNFHNLKIHRTFKIMNYETY